jgi:ATP-dependent Clp protease adapter protein ClpS
MTKRLLTVVFEIKDDTARKQLWDAHKDGTLVCGMAPNIIAWGDQVSVPSDILSGLLELDVNWPDKEAISDLVEMAEQHRKTP